MNTVYEYSRWICSEKNLPEPTAKDLQNLGVLVSQQFKKYWVPKNSTLGEMIPYAGFILEKQGEKNFVVTVYPDTFRDAMILTIKKYLKEIHGRKRKIKKQTPVLKTGG